MDVDKLTPEGRKLLTEAIKLIHTYKGDEIRRKIFHLATLDKGKFFTTDAIALLQWVRNEEANFRNSKLL